MLMSLVGENLLVYDGDHTTVTLCDRCVGNPYVISWSFHWLPNLDVWEVIMSASVFSVSYIILCNLVYIKTAGPLSSNLVNYPHLWHSPIWDPICAYLRPICAYYLSYLCSYLCSPICVLVHHPLNRPLFVRIMCSKSDLAEDEKIW